MAFTIYALPAMLALFTKLGVLVYDRVSKKRSLQSRLFLLMLIALGVQNVAETTFFLRGAQGEAHLTSAGTWWFSGAILAVAVLLHLALVTAFPREIDAAARPSAPAQMLLYGPTAVVQVLLWTTPLLIVGFEPMKYTITKVPGPLYVLLELYLIGYLVAAVGLLSYGAARHAVNFRKLQNRLLLVGLVPLAALALAVIALQRFGFRGFNATVTLPFASTLLLLVAAYAVYRYRLVDVAFYIPWSRIRKRRTKLYRRMQDAAADFRTLQSPREMLQRVSETLDCRVALLGGPQPWLAAPRARSADGERWSISGFPATMVNRVDRVLTVDEMANHDPELHALMKRYKIGVVVPFRPHVTTTPYCLLLDHQFNKSIYSSLDFKMVERLFGAMAQRFFEDFLLARSQLAHVKGELQDATRNLARTEQSMAGVRYRLAATRKQNERLREEAARLRRANFKLVAPEQARAEESARPLDEDPAGRGREALLAALQRTRGKRPAAARLLGIPLRTLNRLIERYRVDPDDFRDS